MILYHYCGLPAFEAIIRTRTIRLSSLALSNDSMEGEWAKQLFLRMASERKWPAESLAFCERQLDIHLTGGMQSLGLCLSEKADMLSQWRGYADDGRGFMIGLSLGILEGKPHRQIPPHGWQALRKIAYDESAQRAILDPLLDDMEGELTDFASLPDDGGRSSRYYQGLVIGTKLWNVAKAAFEIKNPSFREEAEWRFLAHTNARNVFVRADRLVPYIEFDLPEEAVISVMMGPRNQTPANVVLNFAPFLRPEQISRSASTYR